MKGLTLTTREQTRLGIMNMVLSRQYRVTEAAQLIGVSERHTWRMLAAYRKEGAAALAHGNRHRRPSNATCPLIRQEVINLALERYQGVNHSHLTELLTDREGLSFSRSTVRRFLTANGLSSPRRRRPPCHRYRRQRMPQEGMLLQIDGSPHRWLEDRGPEFSLLMAIDDATGTVPCALFREQEDTVGYLQLMQGVIQNKGIPLALYSDRHVVFRAARPKAEDSEKKRQPTQFGRAMTELGVMQIFARSPEAKGRIERANGTFQDRLVSELRLDGARTMAEASVILESFLPRFNERFGVPPDQVGLAYRQLDQETDPDGILCLKERRRVANDNTVQYHGQTLQLYPDANRPTYARRHVEVQERLDGRIVVCYRSKILNPGEAPPLAATLRERPLSPPSPVLEPEEPEEVKVPAPRIPRSIFYEDSEMMAHHRELIRAGMEKARARGKQIGRPRVNQRPEFEQRLAGVMERISLGILSRRKAAIELEIGYATLKRLLDARTANTSEPLQPLVSLTEDKTLVGAAY
jgi:transposase